MELSGEHKIPAPRKLVWDALHDPAILKECIKGCERLEKLDASHMEATVNAKVGPVKATFHAAVEIVDPIAPERYTLVGEGKGGVAGFAKGSAEVVLTEDGEKTLLHYTAKATVGGKLAQLGSRLVDTTAKKYASDFFQAFAQKMEAAATAPGTAAPANDDGGLGANVIAANVIDEGLGEARIAARATPIDSPHAEDTIERTLEVEAGKGSWGGSFMWGILAFAVVILVLIALQ